MKFLNEDGLIVLDNSAMQNIRACFRKGFYKTVLRRELDDFNNDTSFGHILHEHFFWPFYKGQREGFEKGVIAAFEAAPPMGKTNKTLERALEVVREYPKTYRFEDWEQLGTETSFCVRLGEFKTKNQAYRVLWSGVVDLIIRSTDNRIAVVDHKTCSRLGPTYFLQFVHSSQFMGYCYAVSKKLEVPVIDAIVNAVCIPPVSPVAFAREEFNYLEELQEDWRIETLAMVEAFVALHERGIYPKNDGSCRYFNRPCPFFDVCALPGEKEKQAFLASGLYRDVLHDPLAVAEK